MKNKTRLVLIIVFLSLLTITTYPTWKKYIPLMESRKNEYQISNSLNQINDIKEIKINNADSTTILTQNDNNQWLFNNQAKSDQESVQKLLSSIESLSVEQIVSYNEKNLDKFGIKREDGTVSIELIDSNGQNVKLLLGKNGVDYNTFYLKEVNNPSVYLVSGNLNTLVENDASSFKSKAIAQLNPDTINKITITDITLTKVDTTWKKTINGSQETELTEQQVTALNNLLKNIEAQSILSETNIKELQEKPENDIKTIEFFNNDQSQLKLNGVERDNGWWIEKENPEGQENNYYFLGKDDIQVLKGEEVTATQNSTPNAVPNPNGDNGAPFIPMQ